MRVLTLIQFARLKPDTLRKFQLKGDSRPARQRATKAVQAGLKFGLPGRLDEALVHAVADGFGEFHVAHLPLGIDKNFDFHAQLETGINGLFRILWSFHL